MARANARSYSIAACLLLAACQAQSPPAAIQAAAAPRANAQDDRIGIAECDDYIDRYEACLAAHVPLEARDALQSALQQTRSTWRKSAAATSNRAAMASVCSNARSAARPSLAARGCTDF